MEKGLHSSQSTSQRRSDVGYKFTAAHATNYTELLRHGMNRNGSELKQVQLEWQETLQMQVV